MRAVAVVLLVAMGTARADDLGEAKRLEASLEYEPALVIVERVIAQGGADHDKLVELHLWAGKLAAGLDRTAVAQDHFARVLALAPATTLPDGTSPKITGPFDAARATTIPLRVSATVDRGVATISADADPLRLVAGIAIELADHRELREPQSRRVELPDGTEVTKISALDAYGNRLWSQGYVATAHTPPPHPSTPLYARWPVWASVSAVALAAGGVCAWRFSVAQKEWDDKLDTASYTELHAIETRGRRWGLAANISIGAAAVTGIGAVIAYLTHRDVGVTASRDTIAIATSGQF